MPPSWGEILREINQKTKLKEIVNPFDAVRREYLEKLYDYTKRNTIIYTSKWTQYDPKLAPQLIQICDEDIQGFMEAIYGLKGTELDLILHSPGGDPGATEALVQYLRNKFEHIRVIIPHAAMSAATMLACAADEIIMGKHSFIGPVDPQLILQTPLGFRSLPAGAILEQFERAKEEVQKNPQAAVAWYPILQYYGPSLLVEANHAIELSKELVERWLKDYMFKGDPNSKEKASKIAKELSEHKTHKSHGRHIGIKKAEEIGLKVKKLEDDQRLQDLVLSVFHVASITFDNTLAVKIIENHEGRAFIKSLSPPPLAPVKFPPAPE